MSRVTSSKAASKRTSLLRLASFAILVATLGGAGYQVWRVEGSEALPPPAAPAVPVQTALAARADVPVYLTGIGTVEPYNTVTVRSRVDGELQQVLFQEGQDIQKGALLAVIDPRVFQADARPVQGQARCRTRRRWRTTSSTSAATPSSARMPSPASR